MTELNKKPTPMNGPIPVSNPDDSSTVAPSGRQLVIHVKNALDRYQQILEHGLPKGRPKGLSTGFSLLDGMCHGLEPGRIYVIASRPSLGKTTLLLNIIAAVCLEQKIPSLFFSGELQRFEQAPVVFHEENEMERAWRDYRLEKDFPREMA
jgi:replicative DNA helicase